MYAARSVGESFSNTSSTANPSASLCSAPRYGTALVSLVCQRNHTSWTRSSASTALPSIRYAMPNSRGRTSAKTAAACSRSSASARSGIVAFHGLDGAQQVSETRLFSLYVGRVELPICSRARIRRSGFDHRQVSLHLDLQVQQEFRLAHVLLPGLRPVVS